jgi:hypothetical protein
LSKTSWALEFEGCGEHPAHYMLTSSAAVSCAGMKLDQTLYSVIMDMLEDELAEAQYDEKQRIVTLRFRSGVQVEFSNSSYQGGDNSAIITDLSSGSWELFS